MLQSGLSVTETLRTLSGMTSDGFLKEGMESVRSSIHDGNSLQDAFEKAGIFPDIVGASLDAAEKSGQVPEISRMLGEYFEYMHDAKKKILSSLLYPGAVFIALTVASVIISVKLLPQLEFLMPEGTSSHGVSMRLLLGYGHFMKDDWWTLVLFGALTLVAYAYVWTVKKDVIMKYLFQIPLFGGILREFELARIFLNLYIYVKSGIPVTQALTDIHGANGTYVTNKLLKIRNLIYGGMTMGEGFETDPFFPTYVCESLKKGEETGRRSEYLYETYRYYDAKSKDSVNRATRLISPVLMSLAFAFAGFIASFYALIYQRMGTMSTGIYQ